MHSAVIRRVNTGLLACPFSLVIVAQPSLQTAPKHHCFYISSVTLGLMPSLWNRVAPAEQ